MRDLLAGLLLSLFSEFGVGEEGLVAPVDVKIHGRHAHAMLRPIINLSIVRLVPVPPLVEETALQAALRVVSEPTLRYVAVCETIASLFPDYTASADTDSSLVDILVLILDDRRQVLQVFD